MSPKHPVEIVALMDFGAADLIKKTKNTFCSDCGVSLIYNMREKKNCYGQ